MASANTFISSLAEPVMVSRLDAKELRLRRLIEHFQAEIDHLAEERHSGAISAAEYGERHQALWNQNVDAKRALQSLFEQAPTVRQAAAAPSKMIVSVDGGETFVSASSDVRIVYKGLTIDGEDRRGELHVTATADALVTDVWISDVMSSEEQPLDHNIGSEKREVDAIVTRLVEEND